MHLILIDWEKAFDKVSQKGLFSALERMSINPKLISMIRELYKNPRYKVEMDGYTSNWHTQESGIRQGCPLSPYLFLIIMTVFFHDIHQDEALETELKENRIIGTLFDELLYADDTIIYSKDSKTVEKLLHKIEEEGEKYGMQLNQKKCEALSIRGDKTVKYRNGKKYHHKTKPDI